MTLLDNPKHPCLEPQSISNSFTHYCRHTQYIRMYTCTHAPSPSTPRTHFDTHTSLTHLPLSHQLSALVNHWQFSCHQLRPRVGSTLKQAPSTHTRRKRALQWLYHARTHTHTHTHTHTQVLEIQTSHYGLNVRIYSICMLTSWEAQQFKETQPATTLYVHTHTYVCTVMKASAGCQNI